MANEQQIDNLVSLIDGYVEKAHVALDEMADFDQEQVDKICEAIASAGEQNKLPSCKNGS